MGLLFLATALSAAAFLFPAAVVEGVGVPAIYVFGDSSADVGNNNYLPGNDAKANFPFNGIDYPGGKPTGRFCNGYIAVDIIAKKLWFEESPPAYLSITKDIQTLKGVNFASGASGILDATGQNISISLNKQIKYFEEVKHRLKTRIGSTAAGHFLSKSLFVISTGSNDLFEFAIATRLENRTQVDQFIQTLTLQFRDQLETLYKLGARKFAVYGSSHIGCIPVVRLITQSEDCVEPLNEFSRQFKNATETLLQDLASTSKGLSYSFLDAYDFASIVQSDPLKYGFKELKSACCGSGRFNAEAGCTPNATYCSNRDEYLNWDRSHPTTASYKLLSNQWYHGGPEFVRPVNIEQLVKRYYPI